MVLGITGISGSGKHTAAEYFRKRKWVILDTDSIAHYLYRPYTGAWKEINKEFGDKIFNQDDTINRTRLGQIVFNPADPESANASLEKLNGIIHPHMKRYIENEIHLHSRRESDIVIVSALWKEFEENVCDKILLIKANQDIRIKRIMGRDGIPAKMYELRTKNQQEPEKPDFVIENNGSLAELNKKLDSLITKLQDSRLQN